MGDYAMKKFETQNLKFWGTISCFMVFNLDFVISQN